MRALTSPGSNNKLGSSSESEFSSNAESWAVVEACCLCFDLHRTGGQGAQRWGFVVCEKMLQNRTSEAPWEVSFLGGGHQPAEILTRNVIIRGPTGLEGWGSPHSGTSHWFEKMSPATDGMCKVGQRSPVGGPLSFHLSFKKPSSSLFCWAMGGKYSVFLLILYFWKEERKRTVADVLCWFWHPCWDQNLSTGRRFIVIYCTFNVQAPNWRSIHTDL